MATVAALCIDDQDVALCSCVGSASPRVLLNGSLRHQINFSALAREKGITEAGAEALLLACLNQRDLKVEMERIRNNNHQRIVASVCVSALDDTFVIWEEGQTLYELVQEASTVSHFEHIPGGHVTAIVFSQRNFVPQIIASFAMLEASAAEQY